MKRPGSDPIIRLFLAVIVVVIIVMVLKELKHILLPFTIAYILFFVFEPINKILFKWKFPRSAAIIVDLLVVLFFMWIASNVIIQSFSLFAEQLPGYEQKLNKLVSEAAVSFGIKNRTLVNFNLTENIQNFVYGDFVSDFFSSTISLFTAVMFVLLFFIFISTGHGIVLRAIKQRYTQITVKKTLHKFRKKNITEADRIEEQRQLKIIENIKQKRLERVEQMFREITGQIQRFISVKFIITLAMGFIVGFILYLFNVEFYIVFGVLTVLLNFIPNLGSVIGVAVISLMVLIQYESVSLTILLAGILIVIQNIVGNIIEPKIFGDKLGLNPLVILIALLVWGYIWGIVGMLLAVPLTAIMKIVISNSRSKNMKFIDDLMGIHH